jgi:hypothetical protein
MTLSVAIVAMDEEANSRTLASIRWADEVILVDSGSKDRTRDQLVSMGPGLLKSPGADMLRRSSMQSISHQGLGTPLDADEEVSPAWPTKSAPRSQTRTRSTATGSAQEPVPGAGFATAAIPTLSCASSAAAWGGCRPRPARPSRLTGVAPATQFKNALNTTPIHADLLPGHMNRYSSWDASGLREGTPHLQHCEHCSAPARDVLLQLHLAPRISTDGKASCCTLTMPSMFHGNMPRHGTGALPQSDSQSR